MKKASRKPQTVGEYLANVPARQRTALRKLLATIKSAAPGCEECIAYALPAVRYDGRVLVAFGAWANHCAFYPMSSSLISQFANALEGYDKTKGSIHFQPDEPLPATLVRTVVKHRLEQNAMRVKRPRRPAPTRKKLGARAK